MVESMKRGVERERERDMENKRQELHKDMKKMWFPFVMKRGLANS